MPNPQIKVRFTSADRDWIAARAAEAGESVSEFVRTAALTRSFVVYARQHPDQVATLDELYERTRRLLEDEASRRAA